MTEKYRQILLSVMIVIVVMIIIDLVFNFRGIFMENYVKYINTQENFVDSNYLNDLVTNGTHTIPESQKLNPGQHVQSVISKYTGKIINLEPVSSANVNANMEYGNGNGLPLYNIKFNGHALTVLPDGMLGLRLNNKSERTQQFELIYVADKVIFDEVIPDTGKGLGKSTDPTETAYPFFILRSRFEDNGKKNRCLYYDSGKLTVRPIGNYDAIKYDVSYEKVDSTSEVPTHNTSDLLNVLSTDFRAGTGENENLTIKDPDKIKINLDLGGKDVKDILGSLADVVSPDNNRGGVETFQNFKTADGNRSDYFKDELRKQCAKKDFIPRQSVKSICPGCDPNKF